MRKKVLLLALTSVLMSLCIPAIAQQPQTPVQGVIAHIDDSKLFSDSLPPQYRLPEGQTYEDVIRNLPGVEILEDGTITVNGKKVTRILLNGPDIINKEDTTLKRLTAEMIEKVKTYEMTSETQVKKDKTISECYVIEIGAISDQNRARPAYREEFTKKTYQVPEGITVKELILSLPGIKTNILGRLVAKKSKKTIRCIHFNSQWIFPDNTDHLYYTNDTKLKISPYATESPCRNYSEDTKLNSGTAFVKIKNRSSSRRRHGADIVIEYYQDVPYDMIGGNSDYVDLGLSVKWGTRNVGAAGPEEIGGYYSWGETETKRSPLTYKFSDGQGGLTKYDGTDGKSVLDPEDDVAHVKWGGSWRMPTSDEISELIENCTWTWASVNGEIGFLITSNKPGYTDRSIFLPYYYGGTSGDVGYWSGSFNANSNDIDATACLWICFDGHIRSGYCYRHWELPVRPVCQRANEYKLPKGATKEEMMQKFPGLVIDDKGNATINGEPVSLISLDYLVKDLPSEPSKRDTSILILGSGTNDDKPVALSQLTAEMILKVKAYDNYYYKLEKGEYVIEIEPISDETGEKPKYKEYPDGVKTSIIPMGTTVKELLSILPDVETDKDGKLITKNGNDVVTSIVFDDQMLYPKNNHPIYTDDYKLEKGILHIQIIDLDYFKERSWSPLPGDPTEGTARIRINYHPGKDASFIIRHSPDDTRQTGH